MSSRLVKCVLCVAGFGFSFVLDIYKNRFRGWIISNKCAKFYNIRLCEMLAVEKSSSTVYSLKIIYLKSLS